MLKFFCGVFLVNLVWCAIFATVIPYPPKKVIILQPRDHSSTKSGGFYQQTLYDDKYWDKTGPMLFYCGHEKPIESFWNNTGFMFEYAREVKGLVVFAEHRYYGLSMPFERSHLRPSYLQYLSIAQVLEDYVKVLKIYREFFDINDHVPVIAFGGGYGGILAGLMRLKFPMFVEGALISSAPFMWLTGKGHFNDMFASITKVYNEINPLCSEIVKQAYIQILNSNGYGLRHISKTMKLCTPLSKNRHKLRLMEWSRNAFVAMAIMNYPYSSNFLHKLPPAPLNESCRQVSKYGMSKAIEALRDAVGVYYNSTGKLKCFDIFKEYKSCADIKGCGVNINNEAFDYQACTEMPLCDSISYKDTSMFSTMSLWFNHQTSSCPGLTRYCSKKWHTSPEFSIFARSYFDGDFSNASNIIFSNGYLDPWRLGGISENISNTIVSFNIFGGAHHYDLKASNDDDSISVVDVRNRERRVMGEWIKNFNPKNKH